MIPKKAFLLAILSALIPPVFSFAQNTISFNVELEEIVTEYTPANNGASPMWCYGSTVVNRLGDDVFLSTIETGPNVPLLCNTRWQLWHRSSSGWKLAQTEEKYRQREPCPIAALDNGRIFLSVNPSVEPPGVKYGRCRPTVLEFDARKPDKKPIVHSPAWDSGGSFTDHSYRGFASDASNGDLLLLNINPTTSEQYVSYCNKDGQWRAKGKIKFPIRACYPQVALHNHSAHVLAIGDIVEPVSQWKELKFEKLKNQWDYVFRRLFYAYTTDITKTGFFPPIEVDSAEETCGYIQNLDLYIDDSGTAHLLYLKRPFQYGFIRDKYFPGRPMISSLKYITIKDGRVLSRKIVAETPQNEDGIEPSFGRFHILQDGTPIVIFAGTMINKGHREFGNFLSHLPTDQTQPEHIHLSLKHPFHNFFTNTPRGGSKPGNTVDLFGTSQDSLNLRYARIEIKCDMN